MARPKKPLALQEGNLTVAQQEQKKLEEDMIKANTDQLQVAPTWLRDNKAKEEWYRLVKEFAELNILSNLDVNNLGCYCNSYSSYVDITEQLKYEDLVIEYTNKGGQVNLIENPLVKTQIKYSDEMKKYGNLLGLTIDSRLKVAGLKINNKKNNITSKFGDI